MTRVLRIAGLVLALGLALPVAAAERTDVVVLGNEDRFTGEIMGMSRGKLDYKTDDAGRLSIEWLKVARVTSTGTYEIENAAGLRRYSTLRSPPAGEVGVVLLDDGTAIPVSEVVSIVPLHAGFFSRLSAYFDLGFTLAKANSAATLNTDGMVAYRGERMGASFQFNAYLQGSANVATASSASAQVTGDLYFGRWTGQLGVSAEQNSELDLELRLALPGGAAYSILQSNSMVLLAKAGVAGIREQYTTGDPAWYLAGYLGGSWQVFRYDSPKLDGAISLAAFPYLNDFGRVRFEGAIRVKYELFSDFNVGLNLTDTYDTRPPESGTNNDYNISFTVGWSYRR